MSTGVIFILGKGVSPILASGVKSTWPQGSSAPGFSSKHWHDGNGADITSGVMDYNMLNIIRECRRYMGEFVHTAATYEGD